MIVGLPIAAIASVIVVAMSMAVMAQTTATSPPQPSPYEAALPPQPPATGQFSPDELIDAGSHFFGDVSRGLAGIVEKAVSQWGLPNGYILGEEASGAFVGGAMATVRSIQEMPVICVCSGRDRASALMPVLMVRGL
jgi:hypothetical protein